MLVVREIDTAASSPHAIRAGYPAGRALAEVALTLEAIGADVTEVAGVIDLALQCHALDVWDRTVLEAVCIRLGLQRLESGPSLLVDSTTDEELVRTRADCKFCAIRHPMDSDALKLMTVLDDAPVAAQIVYPWRAARALRARSVSVPEALLKWLQNVLSSLSVGIRRDFGLPANIEELDGTSPMILARCIQI